MRSTLSLVSAAACLSVAAAHPQTRGARCGALPSESFMEKSAKMAIEESQGLMNNLDQDSIEVDTYFHVVAASENEADGWITDKMLADQLDVLNESYAPHSISFNLINTTRTINSNWAVDGAEIAMKTELRQGGYDALNVYYMKELGGNLGVSCQETNVDEALQLLIVVSVVLLLP
jgi:hypothetical protein